MTIWEGKRLSVLRIDGYEVVDTRDAVAIVAIDAEQRVVLVRQERVATGGALLEIPAGIIDEGEEPLVAARRELREETGLRGGTWRELVSFWSTPGFVNHRVTVFLACELELGEPDPDQGEDLEIVRWTLAEVEQRLHELADAKTLVGLLLYLRDEP